MLAWRFGVMALTGARAARRALLTARQFARVLPSLPIPSHHHHYLPPHTRHFIRLLHNMWTVLPASDLLSLLPLSPVPFSAMCVPAFMAIPRLAWTCTFSVSRPCILLSCHLPMFILLPFCLFCSVWHNGAGDNPSSAYLFPLPFTYTFYTVTVQFFSYLILYCTRTRLVLFAWFFCAFAGAGG